MKKIFILHGWTYSTEKWKPFINLLKQKGAEVNLLKIPGLTGKIDKVWNINDYTYWLKQTLDNQQTSNETMKQSSNKVVLIGHSNGGRIALNFAIKYPQKLDRLILIDSAGIYHNDLAIRTKRFVFGNIAKIGKKLSSSETLRNLLYKIVGEGDYKNATPIMRQTMVNLIDSDKFLSIDKVEVPTLIIWGRKDKITSLSDGKLMNKLIKNSKLYVVDGAKHSPQFSHAKEVADVIIANLSLRSGFA